MTSTILPAHAEPYIIAHRHGPRRLLGGWVITTLVGASQSDGSFTLHTLLANKHAELGLLRHDRTQVALFVTNGCLDVWCDGVRHRLYGGDYFNVPPATEYGFRAVRHHTEVLRFATGGASEGLFVDFGVSFQGVVPPPDIDPRIDGLPPGASLGEADTTFTRPFPADAPIQAPGACQPEGVAPFALEAREGERLLAVDQMFTFLGTVAHSDNAFFSVMCEGPAGDWIPEHYHKAHAETFYCLHGQVSMRIDGREVQLSPGDFAYCPAGTVHTYRMDQAYTQFIGFLSPGVFEPFFRALGEPYNGHVYPQTPGEPHFDRVMAQIDDLDLYIA